ncbi:hypothetical protein [Flavobacterium sp. PL002]|uniref:hypothetical protein n=1 Tax=Flavobacterium sp. PL002 TaxID=1897058 RepID=UPI0017879C29|nr:hypothetical protein [Flavobacterium sp. PL002]MBE0391729.1 hypothetical protein [Flavobacterium sp. PL002]
MEKYELCTKELYKILSTKGVTNLYHANTVVTSLTFIKNNALLSRSYVEKTGQNQTMQKSDAEDKKYNVWDDVFVDALDLHYKYKRPNKYGPILFVLKLELLLSAKFPIVYITKKNPWYWRDFHTMDDKYYSNLDDVKKDYLTNKLDSQIMFTFKSPNKEVRLSDYLQFIGVDKPNIFVNLKLGGNKNVGDYAFEKIKNEMDLYGLGHIPIKHRHPQNSTEICNCNFNYTILYNANYKEFEKRFK